MRILIFSPEFAGHNARYVTDIVKRVLAQRDDHEFVFAVPQELLDTLEPPVRDALRDEAVACARGFPIPASALPALNDPKNWRRGLRRWFYAMSLARRLGAQHVHYLFFDHALLGALLPTWGGGSPDCSGILFRPSVHYGSFRSSESTGRERRLIRVKHAVYKRILRNPRVAAILSLDEYFADFAIETYPYGSKVVPLPDPVPAPVATLRQSPRTSAGDRVSLLLFGALSERKGVLATFDALLALSPELAARCRMIIAGRIEAEIRSRFYDRLNALKERGCPAEIKVDDRFVDEEELVGLVQDCDVMLAPYLRHIGSSGVLYWAAGAGKPVITSDYGLIAHQTREFELGLTADTLSPKDLAAAIGEAIRTGGKGLASPAGQRHFVEGHTPERFAATVVDTILSSTGAASLAPGPSTSNPSQPASPLGRP